MHEVWNEIMPGEWHSSCQSKLWIKIKTWTEFVCRIGLGQAVSKMRVCGEDVEYPWDSWWNFPLWLIVGIIQCPVFSITTRRKYNHLTFPFQIYVDEVPLPFPGHTLIAVATSVVIGGFIFVAFIFQLRNIHPLRAFRRYVRENPVHQSNISVSA